MPWTVESQSEPFADIVVGLGWGDEGKGATVDALVAHNQAKRVVRFNGGQQAEHNVIHKHHHTFASFGAGTFSNAETWISRYCTVSPFALFAEQKALESKGFYTVPFVDNECLVTTPLHILANVRRDAANGHGTTGTGFGETVSYSLENEALRVKDIHDADIIMDHLLSLENHFINQGLMTNDELDMWSIAQSMSVINNMTRVTHDDLLGVLQDGYTVFEGAQGFCLDENFGYHPHTTWSTTTPANARAILRDAGIEYRSVGCLRSYATRHGNGPLPYENELPFAPEEPHNRSDRIQGAFRVAMHDLDVVKWAADTTDVDVLSVGHLDIFNGLYTNEGIVDPESIKPVIIRGYGPERKDRIFDD